MKPKQKVQNRINKDPPVIDPGHDPPTLETTDAELLDQVIAGDWDAFDRFVGRYERRIFGYISRRCGFSPANHLIEDLAQETFLRVFRAIKGGQRCDGTASVATWLFTIANNIVRDHLRAEQRRPATLTSDLPSHSNWKTATSREVDPAVALAKTESNGSVARLLAELPADQAEVIALRLFGGLRFAEVAKVVGAPITTVKSRMTYGLQKIWTVLNHERNANHDCE